MNRSLALLVLIPLAGACSSGDDNKTSVDTSPTTAPSVTVVAAETADITIADFMFTAAEVHIKAGGSVTWTNGDDQAHTATSSGNFDAGAIDPSQSSTVEFPVAGTFTYVCSFHPFMNGTVVVE
ncbi:MAG: cupredoxin domain-containing protein [Actinomycetia bacterium]|nr:cupredoxin domain-containing protein [Actinomycetes bacterium]